MTQFPSYDPSSDSIRLNGSVRAMLTLLLKAKFGERMDPDVLFHEGVTDLIRQLHRSLGESGIGGPADQVFTREDLSQLAKDIVSDSSCNGWWSMTNEGRRSFLQAAAVPWVLSDSQIEVIFDAANDILDDARQIVSCADGTNAS